MSGFHKQKGESTFNSPDILGISLKMLLPKIPFFFHKTTKLKFNHYRLKSLFGW